jgi:hypothetical protein
MEAYCNPIINYTELSQTVKKQKEIIKETIIKLLDKKRSSYSYSDIEKVTKKQKVIMSFKTA